MAGMSREQLEDLSVLYWMRNLFSDFSGIAIVNEFPNQDLAKPTIAVVVRSLDLIPGELGNRNRIASWTWDIDIFANNIPQRDEFAYRIINALKQTIPVYNFNEGFPPDVTPSQLPCLIVTTIHMENIPVEAELPSKFYYRNWVTFEAIRDEL